MRKNIFISYSDDDKVKMDSLSQKIDIQIFNPIIVARQSNIKLTTLVDKVINGIEKSHYLIPILTRSSVSAQWINQEIGYAKANKNISIIPIVEHQITKNLKGFIHKEFALEYQFYGDEDNKEVEASNFDECINKLLHQLKEANVFIELNEADEQFKNQIKNSKVLGVDNKSRWLLIDGTLHCISDGKTYEYIIRNFFKSRKDVTENVSDDYLNQYHKGRPVRTSILADK